MGAAYTASLDWNEVQTYFYELMDRQRAHLAVSVAHKQYKISSKLCEY